MIREFLNNDYALNSNKVTKKIYAHWTRFYHEEVLDNGYASHLRLRWDDHGAHLYKIKLNSLCVLSERL